MYLEANIGWKAKKDEGGQDIRVDNHRPPDLRIFWDSKEKNHSVVRITGQSP